MLDDDDLTERFDRDGYAVVRNVLNRKAVEQVGTYLDMMMEAGIADGSEMGRTGHYPLSVRLSQKLWAIPRDTGLRAILTVLLRSNELFMHMPPMARFVVPGNEAAAVPAHQDAIYNEHMQDFITVWVPLVPIDDACGGVALYPGRHEAVLAANARPGAIWRDAVDTQGVQPVVPHFEVGDVLIMDNHVIHASSPNVSDHPRISMDLRFFGDDGYSTKHYLDMQTWQVIAP